MMIKKLKLWGLIFVGVMCAGLSSCGGDDGGADTSTNYISTADLVGSWKCSLSTEILTFNTNMTFRRTVSDNSKGTNQYIIDESGIYSLSRCNEHYVGFAYKTIVVNDQFDYVPFEWVDNTHKSFKLKGTIYSKL